MANTRRQVIEIDVISKGLDNLEKEFSKINDNSGDLTKKSNEIKKNIAKMKELIAEYGEEMPISKAKELEKLLKKVAVSSEEISEMDDIKIFGDKELEKFKKITSQIDTLNKKLKQQKQLQEDAATKRDSRIEQLKTQSTVTHTDETGKKTKLSTDSVKGWKSKEDLQEIQRNNLPDSKEYKIATALLQQYEAAERQYANTITESEANITKYNEQLANLKAEKASLSTETRQLTDEERVLAETTNKFATEQAKALDQTIDSQQKLGAETVKTNKSIKDQTMSIGKAAKAFFSWSQIFNLGKKLIRESINTVQDMDKALTGMTMVTGQSREETEKLIPSIQKLSKETSTAMTDVANLITEYTRQGRTLKESFTLAEETAKAAKIAGISTADSITYMTSAINGFNLAATEATRVSDVFANLAAVSATNYEQLAVALSKVSAQANLAGMSMEFTTALLAKGIETTQEAPESIGTALKTVVARMRELSDYGSTLEDGGSVNKVENALAAAGIELRDVNGGFRDLETIFNELGPKWDTLNTMQQQAIAQAVAGTRQQSRFVAIMQDWQRTQELSAEAQDSAGASAAQYAKYAYGMEAAITNLKTSWQSFIQSLTSSKIVIGVVNTLTKTISGIAEVLSGGGDFTKKLVAGLLLVTAVMAGIKKVAKELEIDTKKSTQANLDQLRAKRDLLELEKQRLEQAKKATQEEKTQAQERAKQRKEEIEALKEQIKAHGVMMKPVLAGASGDFVDPTWAEHEKKRLELEKQLEDAQNKDKQETEKDQFLLEDDAILDEKIQKNTEDLEKIQKEYEDAIFAASGEWGKAVKENLKEAEKEFNLRTNVVNALEKQLQVAKELGKSEKEQIAIEQKILKAKADQRKAEIRLNSATRERDKLLKGHHGTLTTIGKTIGHTIRSNLNGILSNLGPIGDILADIADRAWEWAKAGVENLWNTIQEKIAAQEVTEEVVEQKVVEDDRVNKKIVSTNLTAVEGELQDEITDDNKENLGIETAENVVQGEGLGLQGAENVATAVGNKEKKKSLLLETKELVVKKVAAIVEAAKSAAAIPGIGWAIALALLAAVGIAAGAAASKAAIKNSDENTNKKMASQQTTIYDTKKKNKELSSSTEELETLMKKQFRTPEDDARMKELADGLRDQKEEWANLSDNEVLKEAKEEIGLNNDIISRNIDSNYELAKRMEDLTGAVAKQAIAEKMKKDQEKQLYSLVGPNGDMEKAKQMAASMADRFVNDNAEQLSDMVDIQEKTGWDVVSDLINPIDRVTDAIADFSTEGFWAGMDELLLGGFVGRVEEYGAGALLPEWMTDLFSWAGGNAQQKNLDARIEAANNAIVQAAAKMSGVVEEDLYTQLTTFNELLAQNNDAMVKATIKSEYSSLSFLSDITNKSAEASQALSNLSQAGVISAEALKNIAQVALDSDLSNGENLNKALKAWDGKKIKGLDNAGSNSEKVKLNKIRKKLDLDEDASINEIKEAYLNKYAEFGADGSIQYDKNKNIKMKGNNSERTAIYNALNDFAASIGDYADYSKDQLKILKEHNIGIDVSKSVSDMMKNVNKELGLTSTSDFEKLKTDLEFQEKAADAAAKAGYELIHSLYGETETFLRKEESEIEKLQAQYNKLNPESKKAQELLENINARNEKFTLLQQEYEKAVASMTEATLAAAGYISGMEGDEKLKRMESTRSNITEIREKIGQRETLTSDDYTYIRDELAPLLYDLAEREGGSFDLNTFYNDLMNGSDTAFIWLDKLFKDQELTTNIDFAKSLKTFDDQIDEIKRKMANNDLTTEEGMTQIHQKEAERDTQIAQQRTISKLSHEELGLTKQELKLQNARNRVAQVEAEINALTLNQYREKYNYQKKLYDVVYESINQEYEKLVKNDLKSLNISLKTTREKYIKFVNGKMVIDEKWYNSLEEFQQQMVDSAAEKISAYEEEYHKLRVQMIDETKSFYETQISYQDEVIEHYKAKLQMELDAIQESIDKRRGVYKKYFAWLNEEDAEESFEERQSQLQQAIARLSTATDASSLQQLKEYQQELADLEKEHRQEVRDRQLENINTNLDNESEAVDQYYNDLMENSAQLWKDITEMGQKGILDLMTTYNMEYEKATDLNKEYMLLSFKELHANVMNLLGESSAANALNNDTKNYLAWLMERSENPSIGDYNPVRSYYGYSTGGIVDYTGIAAVHGTPNRPEAFLNADQTKLFSSLANNLQQILYKGSYTPTDENSAKSVSIENFTIKIDGVLNADNVQTTATKLVDEFSEQLKLAGYSVNISSRW